MVKIAYLEPLGNNMINQQALTTPRPDVTIGIRRRPPHPRALGDTRLPGRGIMAQ